MANGRLKSGAKPARGGARKGAGRKPDWLRSECARIIDQHKLLEFVGRVASGDETETHVTKDGDVVDVAPRISDRLKAVEFLTDRAHGKPMQAVEVAGKDGGPISWVIKVQGVPNA